MKTQKGIVTGHTDNIKSLAILQPYWFKYGTYLELHQLSQASLESSAVPALNV